MKSLKSQLILLVIFLVLCQYTQVRAQKLKFNEQYEIACHNCYETKIATDILTVLPFTQTLEIDIYDYSLEIDGASSQNQDWYVRHSPVGGNDNCCGGFFSDCLKKLKTWSESHPDHAVITIFIDKKTGWNGSQKRGPADIDYLLQRIFPSGLIYSPHSLSEDCNPRLAAKADKWPLVDSLKGKFIFIITDGTLIGGNGILDEYIADRVCAASCFVAPAITNTEQINIPDGIKLTNVKYLVFYNLGYAGKELLVELSQNKYMSRVWGCLHEDIGTLGELIKLKANFVAFDDFTIGYSQ
jgi:hypothetical protein